MQFTLPIYDGSSEIDRTTVDLTHDQVQSLIEAVIRSVELGENDDLVKVAQDLSLVDTVYQDELINEHFIQFHAIYTGRNTYDHVEEWLDNVDASMRELCSDFGMAFAPQSLGNPQWSYDVEWDCEDEGVSSMEGKLYVKHSADGIILDLEHDDENVATAGLDIATLMGYLK